MPESKINKKVIIVAGPTAVGKTAVAIELAKYFHTEIISADSRQCFRELNIGVARPSEVELQTVKHHFIASHTINPKSKDEMIDAAVFEKFALKTADELFKAYDIVIMVGGTGLYIKAFCESMDDIPVVSELLRKEIRKNYEEEGLKWLQNRIQQMDPAFYEMGEIENPQRLMRALEVVQSTGKSILEFRKGEKVIRNFDIIKIGLELPKEELHNRINKRVDEMMLDGLLKEAMELQPHKSLNALQTVGYKELFAYFDKEADLNNAVELIKRNTRKYAKRQMTWFKKDPGFVWFSPDQMDEMLKYISEK